MANWWDSVIPKPPASGGTSNPASSADNIGSWTNPMTGQVIAGEPGTRAAANNMLANWGFSSLAPGQSMLAAQSGVASGLGGQAVNLERSKIAAQQNAAAAQGSRFGALGNEAARQQDQARAQQMALIKQIQDQAAGRGPSLAQAQLQQANEAAARQAMALGYSQRGAGAAGALKSIREQQAGMTQQNAADSAMLRLQEQLQARQMLGGLLGGMRGQDIGNMQWGLGNQASLGMQQAGLDLARDNSYRQDRLGWEQARQGQAGIDYRNTWGPVNTILGAVGMGGQMLSGGLEAYGQIKKGG